MLCIPANLTCKFAAPLRCSPGWGLLDTRTLLRHSPDRAMIQSRSELASNAIIYSYPCGIFDIIASSEMDFIPAGWEDISKEKSRPKKRESGKKSEGEDMKRSMRRARANVRRLALANDFQLFVTLTLDQTKVDRYDPAAIMKIANRWLDNMVRRNNLRYILVPERHQDGAFHFHGFFSGDILAEKSGHFDKGGHEIYNLPQWPLGFTTAIEIYGDYQSAVGYVCKYIGKQEGERPMGRWYYSGGNLKQPRKEYAILDYREVKEQFCGKAVEFDIPGKKITVVHAIEEDKT